MPLTIIRWISLVCAGRTLGATATHVLELPNKLALDDSEPDHGSARETRVSVDSPVWVEAIG